MAAPLGVPEVLDTARRLRAEWETPGSSVGPAIRSSLHFVHSVMRWAAAEMGKLEDFESRKCILAVAAARAQVALCRALALLRVARDKVPAGEVALEKLFAAAMH